jgi:hypothetical protein
MIFNCTHLRPSRTSVPLFDVCFYGADSFSLQLLLARSIHLAAVPSTSFDQSTLTGAIRFFENP